MRWSRSWRRPGSGDWSSSHGGKTPDTDALGRLAALGMEVLVAGGITSVETLPLLAASGVAGVIVGEALFTGAIDLISANRAAA